MKRLHEQCFWHVITFERHAAKTKHVSSWSRMSGIVVDSMVAPVAAGAASAGAGKGAHV